MIAKDQVVSTRYRLVRLSDQKDIDFTRKQNSQSWRANLSEDDYVTRELVLSKIPMMRSKEERMYVFQLVDAEADNTGLSSIEFWVRKAWRFDFDASTGEVEKKCVLCGCVGGVFTYKEHRGKGYARIMVDKLCKVAHEELIGPDGFIFLYSEVGEYYAKSGFKSVHVPLIDIPVAPPQNGQELAYETQSEVASDGDLIHFIKYDEFEKYMDDLSQHVEEDITVKVKNDHKARVTVCPNPQMVGWFHLRAKYLSMKIFHPEKQFDYYNMSYDQIVEEFKKIEPSIFGIKVCDKEGNIKGCIIWTYVWSSDSGKVSHNATVLKIVVYPDFDEISISKKLILSLKSYLESHYNVDSPVGNTEKIVIWESEIAKEVLSFLCTSLSAQSGLENGSMSAIRFNEPLVNQQSIEGGLIWEGNDKLPWF